MKTTCFSITRQYPIPCKLYTPENGDIGGVIIGVHGFAGDKDSSMLEKLAAAVCPQGTALICFDFPAHGASPVDGDMLTVDNCRQDLLAVADFTSQQYPGADIRIFATSFGGYITLLCGERLRGIPLVLRAPAVTMPKILLQNLLGISAAEFRRLGTVQCGFERPIRLRYDFYEELSLQPVIGQRPISSPTLVIQGDRDDIVALSDIESFTALQKNVTLQILHGADHRFKKPGEMERIIDSARSFWGIGSPSFRNTEKESKQNGGSL